MESWLIFLVSLQLIAAILGAPGNMAGTHPADILTGNFETWKSSATEVGVIIVGAGVSGLTAAKTLLENNVTDILILEADHRIGGRIRTYREGDILMEEGAEYIHGGPKNRLYGLSESLQQLVPGLPDSAWDFRVMTNKGEKSDPSPYGVIEILLEETDVIERLEAYYDTSYGQFYIDRFPEVYGNGWNSTVGQAWFHVLEKTVNAEEGAIDWLNISARDADQFVELGDDYQWKSGYDTLINHLLESIPTDVIRVTSPVSQIFWDEADNNGRVLVVADNGRTSYSANNVIVTVSVGHLKERHEALFQPPLPVTFAKDLNGTMLGVADKIQIGWAETWWGSQDPIAILILWTDRNLPKEMEWMYGIVEAFSVPQWINHLQLYVTGNDAKYMEDLPEDVVKQHVLHLLATSTNLPVPEPSFFRRTQWGQDPWKRGSYSSHICVEGSRNGLHSRDRLATPLVNSYGNTVVQWAGEHTHNTRSSTVDGAMETGEVQAKILLHIIKSKAKSKEVKSHPADIITGNYDIWKSSATEVGVVIVGGGVAGLTAAKTLLEHNVTDILLLEADDRLGGRVRTSREGKILTEEGAEWIHGGPLNPLYRLAQELHELAPNLPESEWDFRVKNNKRQTEDSRYEVFERLLEKSLDKDLMQHYLNSSYGQIIIDSFAEVYGEGWNSDQGRAWFHTVEKLMGEELGTRNWKEVSVGELAGYELYGNDHNWKNGYDVLLNHLTKSIPDDVIRVASPVSKIFWDEEDDEGRVLLVANNGRTSYLARHVIVTVSVGHLKERHRQLFQPDLPQSFINDLKNVELGVADKVQIGWSEPWWGTQDPLYLVLLWKNCTLPKEMEWLYGVVQVRSVHQQTSVLQTFVAGEDAVQMENLLEDTVKQHILHLLATSTGLQIPEPTFFKRTQWGLDPWRRGSYSTYITVEGNKAGLHNHERLAVPLINSKGNEVVLWAGEHTHNTRFSTVDGAMATGERAANNLLRIMKSSGEGSRAHPADILTGNYQTWKCSAIEVGVVIIGGGVAGLTAAKTLLENNITDILILEADQRLGGRVRTYREGDILIEEGAEWIHGNEMNHIYRLGTDLKALSPYEPYYLRESLVMTNEGKRLLNRSVFEMLDLLLYPQESDIETYYNTSRGQYLIDRFPGVYGEGWNTTMGGAWLHLMEMMVNYDMGSSDWRDVPARDFDQFVDYDENHHWKNGYDTLIKHLKKSLPDDVIRLSSPVSKIFWDEDDEEGGRVMLVVDNGRKSYSARHVIFTASIGHLKERHQKLFHPALPVTFTKDLNGADLSVADKIFIGWPESWWGTQEPFMFFIVWTNRTLPEDMEWLYGITLAFTVHQHPNVLMMFITGDNARRMESLTEDTVKQHIHHLLATSTGLQVPEPTFFRRTQWGQDPWKKGSYCSYITLDGNEAGLHSRDRLAVPLVNSKGNTVVLWAGEHTHNTRYSTVDGAMETGEREARRLMEIVKI